MNKIFLLFFLMQLSFPVGPPAAPVKNIQEAVVELRTGWNLVSSPTNSPFETSRIKNIDNETLWTFANNAWTKEYGASIPPGQGFWVKVTKDETIDFPKTRGYLISNLKINDGWNLIGMSTDSERVNDIIGLFRASILWEFKYSFKLQRYVWKERTISDRGSIYEGQGFWLKK